MPVSAGRSGGTALRACPEQFASRRSLTLFISNEHGWPGLVALAGGSRARRMSGSRARTRMAWRGEPRGVGTDRHALTRHRSSSQASFATELASPTRPSGTL